MKTQKQKTGDKGEDIAADFLKDKGYEIVERNFKKKGGEIDIVAKQGDAFCFCEVKTIYKKQGFSPEDKIDGKKRWQLKKMVQIYMDSKNIPAETPVQIDIIAIELDDHGEKEITHFPNALEDTY